MYTNYVIAKLSQIFCKPLSLIRDPELVTLEFFTIRIIFLLFFAEPNTVHTFFFFL